MTKNGSAKLLLAFGEIFLRTVRPLAALDRHLLAGGESGAWPPAMILSVTPGASARQSEARRAGGMPVETAGKRKAAPDSGGPRTEGHEARAAF